MKKILVGFSAIVLLFLVGCETIASKFADEKMKKQFDLRAFLNLNDEIMKKILLAVILITGTLVSLNAKEFEYYKEDGFSISLPEGWIEIPRNVIDEAAKNVASKLQNGQPVHFAKAFQLGNKKNWFAYPYILIQVINSSRFPENKIKKLAEMMPKESKDLFEKSYTGVASNLKIGKEYYDKESNIIWTYSEVNVFNIGLISTMSGTIPTEKGFIQVLCSSLKNNFPKYEPIFRNALLSMKLTNELTYKPRWSDDLPTEVSDIFLNKSDKEKVFNDVLGKVGAIGLIIGIISLYSYFFRKKEEEKNQESSPKSEDNTIEK